MTINKTLLLMQEAGRMLSRIGHWGVPLSLGVGLGYGLSDRGVSWVPTTLGVVVFILCISFLLLPLGRLLQGTAFQDTKEKRTIRKRIVVLSVLGIIAVGARIGIHYVGQPAPLTGYTLAQYQTAFSDDVQNYSAHLAALDQAEQFFETEQRLFRKQAGVLAAADENRVLDAWKSLYDTAFALEQVRLFHEDWYRFDSSRKERDRHLKSFVLMYAAELAIYKAAFVVTQLVNSNRNVVKFLNSPHPSHGLPANSYSVFKQQLTSNVALSRILSAAQYLKLRTQSAVRWDVADTAVIRLIDDIAHWESVLQRNSVYRAAIAGIRADVQPIKRQFKRTWLPMQKEVANAMGDTRVRRVGKYLVSDSQRQKIIRKAQPGDILIARKNWYLSNVGLPGFWPHAILYLGTPSDMMRYFNTPEVKDYVREVSDGAHSSLVGYLKSIYPQQWRIYITRHRGEPKRVIEAVGEGVMFNPLSAVTGDYVAALRPTFSKSKKAAAIVEAFSNFGRPYDFEFDFATDHALVCTELVWRSYRPVAGHQGLRIPLVDIMHRKTLPANELARLYAEERGSAHPQLEFVMFVDANEASQKAFVSTEEAFSKTYRRTKWDMQLP